MSRMSVTIKSSERIHRFQDIETMQMDPSDVSPRHARLISRSAHLKKPSKRVVAVSYEYSVVVNLDLVQ